MDLSRLSRPAILCQCSRCSSSLAALENDWAKLSNSYSLVAGWLSVDLHRISISSEKKQVPQSSDMNLLRGRILQEISCKLCQQKLGVLCTLENGPNIFWKLAKVAFREIVTMRTVEPIFKEGALERILNTTTREARRDRISIQPGALVPAGSTEMEGYDLSVSRQIQHQGFSIDHISSSVSNLHDTMSELKQAFTALRIELNGPGRLSLETGNPGSSDYDMITTVLRELKSKSEEIERLKLEMEAVKLKNRYLEEQAAKQSLPMADIEGALPQVHSPGILHNSRKRPWPDSFPSGRTEPIADSFDDEGDIFDDFSAVDTPMQSMKIPLKDPEEARSVANSIYAQSTPGSPRLSVEVTQHQQQTPTLDHTIDSTRDSSGQPHPIVKRPRVSQPVDKTPSSGGTGKRGPGRPRKSISQTTKPDFTTPKPLATKQTPLHEQTVNISGGSQKERSNWDGSPNEQQSATRRGPGRPRNTRSRSRAPSAPPANSRKSRHSDTNGNHPEHAPPPTVETKGQEPLIIREGTGPTDSEKENPPQNTEEAEKRKTRDYMARMAMQREEAMETEEAR
ncbi:uncharacterized protein ACHE_31342S [Aspergillus chevalieri]|uniref:Uncharacterized protein n=1 Tax=Aspergillus chevalieri TaxID=182096 RepID=A0A7R7VMM1_ASPCH|nr:uncharacterized protein ACHE_31342S [Aspergillus chevalieri]BCR87355.1 hypothetical protein ACHE_31342S [Aspergillus chevalieri]